VENKKTKQNMTLGQQAEANLSVDEKIKKLKCLIEETSNCKNSKPEVSWKQSEKVGKLHQKLRYLEFYRDYDIGPCPKNYKCSKCQTANKPIRKVYKCWKCREILGDVVEGEFFDGSPHERVFISYEREFCDQEKNGDHEKQWVTEEKNKSEVRNMIRREFEAMMRKEKEMKNKNNVVRGKMMTPDQGESINYTNNKKQQREAIKEAIAEMNNDNDEKENDPEVVDKNYHSEDCKTCVRMKNVMGQVLPHPINV